MLARKIVFNTILSVVSRMLAILLALVLLGFITRYLGQDGFGNYSTVLAFLYVFSVLADLGLYSITVREISKIGAKEEEIVSRAFSLRFLAGFFIFGLAPLASLFFPYSTETRIGIALGAIGFWFFSNAQVLVGVFQKYLKMEKVALADLAGRIVQLALVWLVIYKKLGFLSVVLTFGVSGFVNFLLTWIFAKKYINFKFIFDLGGWRKILGQSLPLALSAIFVMIYFKVDTIMLSVMQSPEAVGIYSVSYKILESLIFFPSMFVGLVMPLLSRYAFAQPPEFKAISQKTFNILLVFALPMAVGGFFLSESIVRLIAGPDFFAAAGVLKILIVATAVIFFGALFSNMIIALEKQRALAKIYASGAAINFAANLVLIPKFSYWGAAFSTLATELFVTIFMMVVIKKTINHLPSPRLFLKVFLASGLMALALYFFRDTNLVFSIFVGGFIYFFVIFILRVVSLAEFAFLIKGET